MFLLGLSSSSKRGLALEHLIGDLGHSVSDSRIRSPLELSSSGDVFGVLRKERRFLSVQSLSESGNFLAFLLGK